MSIGLIVILVVVAIIAIVLLLAARKSDTFHVQRSLRINASPERLFPQIDDIREHAHWSPFDQPDGKTTSTYSNPSHGVGAEKLWSGNGKNGAGRYVNTVSVPASRVEARLQMTKPMACDHLVTFTLAPVGAATDVTWSLSGDVPFFAKIFHVFCDVDKMCGREFEKGLAALKSRVEQA